MSKKYTFMESAAPTEVETDFSESVSTLVQELTGKKWKVRVLQGDKQGSSAFYPKELLEANQDIVKENTRIFLDHKQDGERPERKSANLVGVFASDSYYENGDLYAEVEIFSDRIDWVKERVKAGVIGLSIHGSGNIIEENGIRVAQTIDAIHSVDIVTQAGAGGEFIEMTESATEKEETMELPKELLEALDKQDKLIESAVETMTEATKNMNEFLEAQAPQEEEEIEESKGPTAAEVSEALVKAELTEAGRKGVYEAVTAGVELEEAIQTEKDREKEILESSRVQEFGTGGQQGNTEKKPVDLIFG